jgi:uncharacterized protein
MRVNWSDLGAAFALYLVLEGLFPFLNPATVKQAFASIIRLPDQAVRLFGLTSMIAGCLLLYFIRS